MKKPLTANLHQRLEKSGVLGRVLFVALLLVSFLVGVKCLSTGIKMLGGEFAASLFHYTSHPILSLFVGIITTSLVQSSSVTTSIIVGLVSSGTLPMANAIPMIMGANVGTALTNTLIAIASMKDKNEFQRAFAAATVHDIFNILSVLVLLPLELAFGFLEKASIFMASALYGSTSGLSYSSPIKALLKPLVGALKYVVNDIFAFEGRSSGLMMILIAGTIIILSLGTIVKTMKALIGDSVKESMNRYLAHPLSAIGFGIVATMAVQSSSITTSLLVPLAGAGVLSLDVIFPITLGANLGTTTTALLASLAGNVSGLAIALVHFLFNMMGILIWYFPMKLRVIPKLMAHKFAEVTANNKFVGMAYIFGFFFVKPLFLLWIFN